MISFKLKARNLTKLADKIRSKLVDGNFNNQVKQSIIPEIKNTILAGVSPVKGNRRFAAYKDKVKYPGIRKPSRPVNLKLTGAMLNEYTSEIVDSKTVRLGISKNASEEIKTYAEANNVGTEHIKARRFVPLRGESYNVTIMRKIKDLFAKRISTIINK